MESIAGLKHEEGWWFPDYEKHLPEWMRAQQQIHHGRLCYQAHKYELVTPYLRHNHLAIDVGAHIGLWSFLMAHDFNRVAAFEPVAIHRQCHGMNLANFSNVDLYAYALGAHSGSVALETRTDNSSGDTGISGDGDIPMLQLDSFGFKMVSLIKIDCEGYEAAVIKGAEETIRKNRPVVIVEQKGTMGSQYGFRPLEAVTLLERMGMELKCAISGDFIMGWE